MTSSELVAANQLIALALAEDLGQYGDITSRATVDPEQPGTAEVTIRAPGVIAGQIIAQRVALAVDPKLSYEILVADGTTSDAGIKIACITGPMVSILSAERTILNFLQRMTGVATLTAKYVEACRGTCAQILDTRKTLPGWRLLDKYAVRMGGGTNHRMGLFDAILIKDNHISAQGKAPFPVRQAVERARAFPGNAGKLVEIEVDRVEQFREVLPLAPEIVLLDNMSLEELRDCVQLRNHSAPGVLLEASGGVNLSTVRDIALTGVDRISVGAVTHSAPALDIGLDHLQLTNT
jgi:nicotinate-nucleotide pyrophosphorylase (carboxylating)